MRCDGGIRKSLYADVVVSLGRHHYASWERNKINGVAPEPKYPVQICSSILASLITLQQMWTSKSKCD